MNSEHPATPWVELELITLSASEKVIGHGNTVQHAHMYYPGSCSDKPVHVSYLHLYRILIPYIETVKYIETAHLRSRGPIRITVLALRLVSRHRAAGRGPRAHAHRRA